MNITVQVILAFGSVLVLLTLMAIVKRIAHTAGLHAEIQRKLVHIGTGLYALTLPWLFPDRWPVYMLIVVTLFVMGFLRLPKVAKSGLGSTLHSVDRQSYGDVLLALSIGLCFFLAQGNTVLYVLPIAVLTLADAAAALVGSAYGRRIFKVEDSHKSVEGSVVFFIVTLLISLVVLLLFGSFSPANVLALSLMIAAFGTLVEADSWRGFDNLFLPLGLLVFLKTHGNSDILHLLVLAMLFLLALLGLKFLAPKLGLTRHASRVYVVAVFLLLAVTDIKNALLPILVLFSHAWCRSKNPCQGRFPDLDVVAALALISFGWLTIGNATGNSAISFYGMHAMGMTMGLAALALGKRPVLQRVGIATTIAIGLFFLRVMVVSFNSANANWAEPLLFSALATLALTSTFPLFLPGFFCRNRIAKLALLSGVVPLAMYLFEMEMIGK